MKPLQFRRPMRLKAALLALSLVAMTTQVGGASAALGVGEPPAAQLSVAAALPMPGERELLAGLAWLTRVVRLPPESGNWALLIAGLTGAWAIGHRRRFSFGSRALDPYRLHQ